MSNICLSSEIYSLDPQDLIILEDSLLGDVNLCDNNTKVVILIGDEKKGINDTLLKGRYEVEKAIADGEQYIPVRVAFVSRTKKYDFLSPIIRKMRYKYKSFSSNIYHTKPADIRRLKIERNFRTKDNAYTFTKKKYRLTCDVRKELYDNLYNSMKNKGFDDRYPIDIMLCRSLGVQDTLDQGHHRMSVAIDCNLDRVSVRFGAAGCAPKLLRPIFRLIAKISLFIKR